MLLLYRRPRTHLFVIERAHGSVEAKLTARAIGQVKPFLCRCEKGYTRAGVRSSSCELQAVGCGPTKLVRTIGHRSLDSAQTDHEQQGPATIPLNVKIKSSHCVIQIRPLGAKPGQYGKSSQVNPGPCGASRHVYVLGRAKGRYSMSRTIPLSILIAGTMAQSERRPFPWASRDD